MGDLETSRLNTLAGEIKLINRQTCDAIQQIALHAAIEIGRRLVEAKQLVAHGEWGAWLEAKVDYSQRKADNFMNVYKAYGTDGKSHPDANLNYSQALALLGIKDADERAAFRSEEHEVEGRDGTKTMKAVSDMSKREIEKSVKEWKARAERAEQERDEAKRDARSIESTLDAQNIANSHMAQELEEAKRDNAIKQSMLDAAAQTDKANNATIASLREELAAAHGKQPEPEIRVVEKRVEVIPDEYKKAFMENQRNRRELAKYKAHEKGQTLQEFAEIEEGYADLQKSVDEERATELKLEAFSTIPAMFNYSGIEVKELVRCYMKYHAHEKVKVKGVLSNIEFSINTLTNIRDCLAHAVEAYKQYEEETQKVELRAVK